MEKESKKEEQIKLHIELVRQMLTLATAGFGLVAALAWNSLIQELVNTYIKVYLPDGYGVLSLLAYAVIVTALAVFVTLNLSRLLKKLEKERTDERKKS